MAKLYAAGAALVELIYIRRSRLLQLLSRMDSRVATLVYLESCPEGATLGQIVDELRRSPKTIQTALEPLAATGEAMRNGTVWESKKADSDNG